MGIACLHFYADYCPGKTLDMALHTLSKMAAGGMHDALGGGFHRYSVDDFWHVPHFEKMMCVPTSPNFLNLL